MKKKINPEEFHSIEIKYSCLCKTEQERDLFVDFIAAMKKLKESGTPNQTSAYEHDFKFILQKCYIQLFFNLRKEGDFVNDPLLNEIEKILGFVPYAEDESNGKYCPKCDKCFLLKNFDTHHCFKYFEGN